MPIEHKTFGCAFKCGRRYTTSEHSVIKHEKTCWKNPELKTCLSCSNQVSRKHFETHHELPGSPVEEWHERGCLHPHGEGLIGDNLDGLKHETGWIKPIVGCPFHNVEPPEEIDEDLYYSEIRSQIKNVPHSVDDSPF